MRTLTISVGESRRSTNWIPKEVTWEQLCRKLQTPVRTSETMAEWAVMDKEHRADVKDVGGYVGGRIRSGHRKAGNITDRQIICLDADYAGENLWDVWELMVGKAALMHSSHSHTPKHPRFRLVIPLSRPVTAAEYEPIARKLAEALDIDAFDDTTYEAERLMYWPSCSSDAEYICKVCDSEDWVDPDEILASYTDWRDMREWPTSSRQSEVALRTRRAQGDPLAKPGVIGAFNRAYRITEAIEKFLPDTYTQVAEDRWTYNGGTTMGGAVTYDDDTFIYSHHGTDPISERLCNAFDLVRIHKFGDLDIGSTEDIGNLPSVNEMKKLCANDEKVRGELAACGPRDGFEEVASGVRQFDGDLTEIGSTSRFTEYCGNNLRYSKPFGWLYWDGVRWVTDADMEAYMLIWAYSDKCYREAVTLMNLATTKEEKARAKAVMANVNRLRSAPGFSHLREAAKAPLFEPRPEAYDTEAWELNTPGGIVNLKTGEIGPSRKSSRHTKCTAVTPGPDGQVKWQAFIDHVSGGDAGLAEYLQTLIGMAAVGSVYEEGLVITYGDGGNGKSTFFNAISHTLGDYAKTINADVLVASYGRTDQSYIAALRGARLVVLGETDEGAMLGAAQLKRITSRDVISARALYKDPIEFTPTHTTVMHTNHLPRLGSLDGGVKRRIAVAPFTATLPSERVITDYSRVLADECGPAIMRWIIDGAVRFYAAGCKLERPECVKRATVEYLEREDAIGQFLTECCVLGSPDDPGCFAIAAELIARYQEWLNSLGHNVRVRGNEVAHALESRGIIKERVAGKRVYKGVKLIPSI